VKRESGFGRIIQLHTTVSVPGTAAHRQIAARGFIAAE
jgi:hypothetical protein